MRWSASVVRRDHGAGPLASGVVPPRCFPPPNPLWITPLRSTNLTGVRSFKSAPLAIHTKLVVTNDALPMPSPACAGQPVFGDPSPGTPDGRCYRSEIAAGGGRRGPECPARKRGTDEPERNLPASQRSRLGASGTARTGRASADSERLAPRRAPKWVAPALLRQAASQPDCCGVKLLAGVTPHLCVEFD